MIIKFKPEHSILIQLQEKQKDEEMTPQMLEYVASQDSYTIIKNNEIMFCCGIIPTMGIHSCLLWSLFSQNSGKHIRTIMKETLKKIEELPYKRFQVVCEFEEGERLAKMLGFEYEGTLRQYRPNKDAKVYARIK